MTGAAPLRIAGCDGCIGQAYGPDADLLGVSTARACAWGLGYWRDERHLRQLPDHLLRGLSDPSPHRRAVARRLVAGARGGIGRRNAEIRDLQQLRRRVGEGCRWPLKVVAAEDGTIVYELEEAFRRWLAYHLAYEASLTAGSLAPYDRLASVISGTSDRLRAASPGPDEPAAFSILLNTLSLLDRTRAYEASSRQPHESIRSAVVEGDVKRRWLRQQLDLARKRKRSEVGVDAEIAMDALVREADFLRDQGIHFNLALPEWGKIGGAAWYDGGSTIPRKQRGPRLS